MKCVLAMFVALGVIAIPCLADPFTVSTSGKFSASGSNVWIYDSFLLGNSTVTFTGISNFSSTTPANNVKLGALSVVNGLLNGGLLNQSSSNLTISATFNPPPPGGSGSSTATSLGVLELVSLGPDVVSSLDNFENVSFNVVDGLTTFTVTLDGFFASSGGESGSALSSFTVGAGATETRYLYGDITARTAAVPEPSAALLLGTVLAALGLNRLRRRSAL